MSPLEKEDFIKVTRDMPWLYGPIMKEIGLHLSKIKSILDVGCADGLLLGLIHQQNTGLDLAGIDIDSHFIKKAKENFSYEFKVADGYTFKERADLIISNLSLHHFDRPDVLIKHMLTQSNYGVIISDQIRPETEDELLRRIEKHRSEYAFKNSEYYITKEKESILEAYSKDEINKIFTSLGLQVKLNFLDNDYYERFVATILIQH